MFSGAGAGPGPVQGKKNSGVGAAQKQGGSEILLATLYIQ